MYDFAAKGASRVVLVSNRVEDMSKTGQAGGMAVVLGDVLRARQSLWFGWNGAIETDAPSTAVDLQVIAGSRGRGAVATVSLSPAEHRDYYLGYSNSVLWPVFHNRLDLAKFQDGYYTQYAALSARFARVLAPLIASDDLIWIHDYHLIPLASELRKRGVNNPIGFFLHIPVPPPQTFLAIPEHRELARQLSAYDLIGLQTRADVGNLIKFFEDSVSGRILQDGRINVLDSPLTIRSFPVGIKSSDFAKGTPAGDLVKGPPGTRRIIGVDRLDYTKGLPEKFRAFGRFLETYPDYRRRVNLTQIAPPTRESVEAYCDIRSELERLSGEINGKYGDLDWVPIQYIHRSTTRKRLRDVYRASSIGLITPLRDGMNLVVKEYVASQDADNPGVPILSRFTGAAEEMSEALIVNPYNADEVSDAIRTALEMKPAERKQRHASLLASINRETNTAWSNNFLRALAQSASGRTNAPTMTNKLKRAVARLS